MKDMAYIFTTIGISFINSLKLVGFPVKFGKTPASITRKPPEFGEHTEEILLEVGGYTWEEIAELKDQQVI